MKLLFLDRPDIKPNKNPRKTFEGIEELRENIKAMGIITPLIVDLNHHLIDGERRWRASEGVLKKLPCVEVDRKDWDKPDKRLEIQISIDSEHKQWNAIERAEAWKRYLDLGHSIRELQKLLGHKEDSGTVAGTIKTLVAARVVLDKLRKDDTNWTWHRDVEIQGAKLPEKQRHIIHQRIFDKAYQSQDDLNESLRTAVENPELAEKLAMATSKKERTEVHLQSMISAERAKRKFVKPKSVDELKATEEERIYTGLIEALNSINSVRIFWQRSDAIELVKKHASKDFLEEIKGSIKTIIKAWTKTLKELEN